jgi:hypothetical protein
MQGLGLLWGGKTALGARVLRCSNSVSLLLISVRGPSSEAGMSGGIGYNAPDAKAAFIDLPGLLITC